MHEPKPSGRERLPANKDEMMPKDDDEHDDGFPDDDDDHDDEPDFDEDEVDDDEDDEEDEAEDDDEEEDDGRIASSLIFRQNGLSERQRHIWGIGAHLAVSRGWATIGSGWI